MSLRYFFCPALHDFELYMCVRVRVCVSAILCVFNVAWFYYLCMF